MSELEIKVESTLRNENLLERIKHTEKRKSSHRQAPYPLQMKEMKIARTRHTQQKINMLLVG